MTAQKGEFATTAVEEGDQPGKSAMTELLA
jgi:hypothetical protein